MFGIAEIALDSRARYELKAFIATLKVNKHNRVYDNKENKESLPYTAHVAAIDCN